MAADAHAALSDGERQVLALLATGHTAKSIAAELGLTVNAVNERLREARRKTGASSSRELARTLAAAPQENRDDLIRVARKQILVERPMWAAHRAWLRLGVPLMILAILFAVAALYPQASASIGDPMLGSLLARDQPDAATLHASVRAQPRDAAAEALLLTRYGALPDMTGATSLRVICGDTLCEVAGEAPGGRALVDAQRLGLSGLKGEGFTTRIFRVGSNGAGRTVFMVYLARLSVAAEAEPGA